MSRSHPGVFWVHDDGSAPTLHAVDAEGRTIGTVRLEGVDLRDWEDLALSSCPGGDCLYVGDLGDNAEQRDELRVHRLREPDPRTDTVASVQTLRVRLPDGPRDVEALFVLPGERIHVVSKGRNHPVSVYRYPGPLSFDSVVVLEEVQRLSDGARALPRQVTGAEASPGGDVVAVRTYETLGLFRVDADTLASIDGPVNLRTLREPQGEGVGIGEDGLIALVSEAGPADRRGSMVVLRCDL